ncbi:hypothetical protein AAFC00_005261 [Neodothiora populina]|uniref:Zn(2)-C6 fungal-type domain-containing protein n=1 Tax=Neodothiora populina TaxID=2781224 RepID=A0ABR3PLE2_9PEZI
MNTRISKACQECRQRKIRCSGERPCKSCRVHNAECVYRALTRVRKSYASSAAGGANGGAAVTTGGGGGGGGNAGAGVSTPSSTVTAQAAQWQTPTSDHPDTTRSHATAAGSAPTGSNEQFRDEEVYHSVSATHNTTHSGTLQIYYGASSYFAFLQQLHRSLLLDDGSEIATPGEVQEGGAGLDLFYQKGFFFGTSAVKPKPALEQKWDALPADLVQLFMNLFFETLFHVLSFVREEQIRSWANLMFDSRTNDNVTSGQRCITLAVLALGAITTEHTDWAEMLYKAAKVEANDFDEVVNLQSVQFSLLLAIYQSTLGRPNQSYLHLGSATRKGFAMGLHKDIFHGNNTDGIDDHIQDRRLTMWCLYFHERWQAFSLGRVSSVRRSDISCPLPETATYLAQSARLLDIAMQCAETMFGNRRLSLWETWKAAKSVHGELRRFAEEAGLAFAYRRHEMSRSPMQCITLTSFYYHAILITFRPFLIVAAARQRQRRLVQGTPGDTPSISLAGDEMWLREACRYAVDAARDQITFVFTSVQESDVCKRLRYTGFFMESSCAVLLYDSLMNKHTYSHNLEYIKAGLQCLKDMQEVVPGEPLTLAIASIERILFVAQRKMNLPTTVAGPNAVSDPLGSSSAHTGAPMQQQQQQQRQRQTGAGTTTSTPQHQTSNTGSAYASPIPGSARQQYTQQSNDQQQQQHAIMTPTMDSNNNNSSNSSSSNNLLAATGLGTWDQGIPQMDWGFDVFTTDLNHYFTIDDTFPDAGNFGSGGSGSGGGNGNGSGEGGGMDSGGHYLSRQMYRDPYY